jgi:hypothetical protein
MRTLTVCLFIVLVLVVAYQLVESSGKKEENCLYYDVETLACVPVKK